MALKNMSLVTGATIGVSGGSALVFADDGQTIQNGVHLVVPADADYATRRQLTAKYRPPTVNPATGSYGKDKKSIVYVKPYVDSTSGKVFFCTWRLEREVHPGLPAADVTDGNKIIAQCAVDADTEGFWATGSTT